MRISDWSSDVCSSDLQSVAIHVANALIENLEFHAFREMNRVGYKGYLKKQATQRYSCQRKAAVKKLFAAEDVAIDVSEAEKVNIGTKCIELAAEATGMFVIEQRGRKRGYAMKLKA